MTTEELRAEINNLRLDLEHLSGVNHAQSLIIRELLKATPEVRSRIEKYFNLAAGTDHGGGFSEEQLNAIDLTLKSALSAKRQISDAA